MILRFLSLYLTNTNYIVNILSVYHVPDTNALSYWTLVSGPIIILWKGLNNLVKLYHKSDGVGIQTWMWLQSPKPIIQYHLWVSLLSLEFWIWLGKKFSGHLLQPLFSYLNHGYNTLSKLSSNPWTPPVMFIILASWSSFLFHFKFRPFVNPFCTTKTKCEAEKSDDGHHLKHLVKRLGSCKNISCITILWKHWTENIL